MKKQSPAEKRGGLIILGEFIERSLSLGFEDSVAELEAMGDLIAHNPHYQKEAAAMRQLGTVRDILVRTTYEARDL
jgi:hypothetical protein